MKPKRKALVYEYSYDEISNILGLTRARVRQIEKEALNKIGKQLEALGINL